MFPSILDKKCKRQSQSYTSRLKIEGIEQSF